MLETYAAQGAPSDLPGSRIWPPTGEALARLFDRGRLQRARQLQGQILEVRADGQGASARVRGAREQVFELDLQGVADASGQPRYSALCSCRTQRFCEHAAAVLLKVQIEADAPQREALLQQWVQALRRKASRDELKRLPPLPEADAARLMDLLLREEEPGPASAAAPPPAPIEPDTRSEAARFQPELRLMTLGRGDGLLGLAPGGRLGPRGDHVSVAQLHWVYRFDDGCRWQTEAPRSLLNSRPPAQQLVDAPSGPRRLARDLLAEAEARDQLWASGLIPLAPEQLQWRHPSAAQGLEALWTLSQEEFFAAFWLERVPALQAAGWKVEVRPGFAHRPAPAEAWQLKIEKLGLPGRQGSWLLSLGVEVDGETLDLAPMIADLLRRDARWFDAEAIAGIDDAALILLHAPGGRRIEAPGSILKPIIGAMVDLLSDPKRAEGADPAQRLGRRPPAGAGRAQWLAVPGRRRSAPPGPAPAAGRQPPAGGAAARPGADPAALPAQRPGLAAIPARAGPGRHPGR